MGLSAIILQGSTYTALKTEGHLRDSARRVASKILVVLALLFLAALVFRLITVPESAGKPLLWVFTVIFCAALAGNRHALSRGNDMRAFILSSTGFAALWGIAGSLQFPRLVTSLDPANHITAMNASSGPMTLGIMLIIAGLGMPLVILYTIFVYRIFKGKVKTQ
jgi:cytochrome d ubiquinol oxidase subunit II